MPDVAIVRVVLVTLHHLLHRIDLIGPHDHELLLADDEDPVVADGLRQGALLEEAVGKLGIGEADAVQLLELGPEVPLQRRAGGDVRAILVFQTLELLDESGLDMILPDDRRRSIGRQGITGLGRRHGRRNTAGQRRRCHGSADLEAHPWDCL